MKQWSENERYFHFQTLYLRRFFKTNRVFWGSRSCFLPPDGDGSLDGTTKPCLWFFSPEVRIDGSQLDPRSWGWKKVFFLSKGCQSLCSMWKPFRVYRFLHQILPRQSLNWHSPWKVTKTLFPTTIFAGAFAVKLWGCRWWFLFLCVFF